MKRKILTPLLLLTSLFACASKRGFIKEESNKRLVFSCTNKTNTSYAGIEAHYETNGITIDLELEDDDLYAKNIYDISLDDNIEFLISERVDSTFWVEGKTFHFLINGAGKIYFQVANSINSFGPSLDPSLRVVLGENLIVNFQITKQNTHGFNGFKASVYFSYDVIGSSKEKGFANICISPAMRNTHAYQVDTEWVKYEKRGCSWSNPSMFIPISANNEFI